MKIDFVYRNVLNEDRESDMEKKMSKIILGYIKDKVPNNMDPLDCARKSFDILRRNIPNIGLPLYTNTNGVKKRTYKFAEGVIRMYYNGDLCCGSDILGMNTILKHVSSDNYVNKYDSDFNGLWYTELKNEFADIIRYEESKARDASVKKIFTEKSEYTVVPVPNFETARKYSDYTSWCITKDGDSYYNYTNEGEGMFYFCLRNGFENEEAVVGENAPLDDYGLSMIAVSVNDDGSLNTITCRWNHDNGGNDHVMGIGELEDLIKMGFYKTFKPRKGNRHIYTKLKDIPKYLATHSKKTVLKDIGECGLGGNHLFRECRAYLSISNCAIVNKMDDDGRIKENIITYDEGSDKFVLGIDEWIDENEYTIMGKYFPIPIYDGKGSDDPNRYWIFVVGRASDGKLNLMKLKDGKTEFVSEDWFFGIDWSSFGNKPTRTTFIVKTGEKGCNMLRLDGTYVFEKDPAKIRLIWGKEYSSRADDGKTYVYQVSFDGHDDAVVLYADDKDNGTGKVLSMQEYKYIDGNKMGFGDDPIVCSNNIPKNHIKKRLGDRDFLYSLLDEGDCVDIYSADDDDEIEIRKDCEIAKRYFHFDRKSVVYVMEHEGMYGLLEGMIGYKTFYSYDEPEEVYVAYRFMNPERFAFKSLEEAEDALERFIGKLIPYDINSIDKKRTNEHMAVKDDRSLLEGLVEKYGKDDVNRFIGKISSGKGSKALCESYRQVDDLNDYILQNGLQLRRASKFQRINAVRAKGGERVVTIASDGTQETTNVANPGDWIVNNVSNPDNRWIINAQTFAKKYQEDPIRDGVYMPKGGPMNAVQIDEPISFMAPWGEQMNIDTGGYILQDPTNPSDIYGISKKDFDSTYRFNESVSVKNDRDLLEGLVEKYGKDDVLRYVRRMNENLLLLADGHDITVGELIEELEKYDPDTVVCISSKGSNTIETIDAVHYGGASTDGDDYGKIVLLADRKDLPYEDGVHLLHDDAE